MTSTGDARPICVITGASAGVGRATAIAFAEAGYDVGLMARGEDGLRHAADDVLRNGHHALPAHPAHHYGRGGRQRS